MKKFFAKIPLGAWLGFFVFIALVQVWLTRNVVMGDAYIHFVFARGIADSQPFFYNGDFSAGSTSPLWSALLAPLWLLLKNNIIWGVKIFASVFVASAVVLTYFLAEKISKNKTLGLIASALLAGSYVLSYWASKGMETPLYVCLILASFLLYLKILEVPQNRNSEILLGTLLGLAILTRPEAWFFSAFLGITLLIKKGWRVLPTVGLPALLVISPYYLWLYKNTGQIFPSSAARILRARQWAHSYHGFYYTFEIFKILVTKLLPLTPFFLLYFWKGKLKHQNWFILGPILAWLIFHLFFFSTVLPTTEGYRYLLSALPFFYLLALLGVWKIQATKTRSAVIALVLVGSFAISGQQLHERTQSIQSCEVPYLNAVRQKTGIWLKENTEKSDIIAMKEIDQSAFYSGRRMLSLDGTLNTKALPSVKNHDQLTFLRENQADWLVLEEDMYLLYPDWKKSNLLPLINHKLKEGDLLTIENINFILTKKIPAGDPAACSQFKEPLYWYIYAVSYSSQQ